MRLTSFLLFFVVKAFALPGNRWGKLTAAQVEEFKESLGRTDADKFHDALLRARETARFASSAQSDVQIKEFNEAVKVISTKTLSKKSGGGVSKVNINSGIAEQLYKGDMILTNEQIDILLPSDDSNATGRKKRQAQAPALLWENDGTTKVYYEFAPSLTPAAKAAAQAGINFWHKSTCIDFVQSTTATNRIKFFRGSGCFSNVGMTGGVQTLSLGDGCETIGHSTHEIGHALGFWHTQSRWDRDTYLNVYFAKIPAEWRDQFTKETKTTNANYGMPHDYGSVMHYDGNELSPNGQTYMVTKATSYQDNMGSYIVGFYDVAMMNTHYKCTAKCTTGATCLNGGIRNSRACNTCLCPAGWSGATCNTRPTGCGSSLTAKAAVQSITIGAGTAGVNLVDFTTCNYLITGPVGKKLEIVIATMNGYECLNGCFDNGIEIKSIADHRYTGIRKCCSEDAGTKIVSQKHIVPIIAFTRFNRQTARITYRWVESTVASTATTAQIPATKPSY
ncbi:unnamed protein product, partial [Mesorhabditis belari]|uniref:Zinc metalloproteinase n=1 Tax=Mesorhabditis belari TaxID=2138241 RepID=A0AAF3JB53_9BILA